MVFVLFNEGTWKPLREGFEKKINKFGGIFHGGGGVKILNNFPRKGVFSEKLSAYARIS